MNAEKTILIVDDTRVNILKAEYILKDEHYNTRTAMSGEQCLKRLSSNKIDLILLDIEMPQMDGFQTLDAIRADERFADIPVIFVTGDNEYDTIVAALKKKVAGYVTKPFDSEELLTHVRQTLAKKEMGKKWEYYDDEVDDSPDTEESGDTEDARDSEESEDKKS